MFSVCAESIRLTESYITAFGMIQVVILYEQARL